MNPEEECGMKRWTMAAAVVGVVALPLNVEAQWVRSDEGWCDDSWGNRDQDRECFVLEADFPAERALRVDGGRNGGISIEGWERDVIAVRAKVWANASSLDRARALADDVRVRLDDGRLEADGPNTGRREHWGVSWEVMVPRSIALDLETHNGGIDIADVRGDIRFDALNGGADLRLVGCDVVGQTTNGGLHIELDGSRWSGEGLDVETTNGGVTLIVPDAYSARLETGTVNGGIDIDFPITVQGRIGRRLSTTLGEGGPTIRATTTNGGVEIRRGGRAIR